jgi:exopolysaccharide production protein ExoY
MNIGQGSALRFDQAGRDSSSEDNRRQRFHLSSVLKRAFDLSSVTLFLLLFFPLLLTIGLLIWITDGRPILIRHPRVGRNAKLFPCLKFRTMVVDAEEALRRHLSTNSAAREEWEATRKLKEDPRITTLGHLLRRSSVDELPQFINILRGEMSLVGPRPIVPDEAVHYGAHFETYCSVRPGLTGLWQVEGRNDVSYQQRVQLDSRYANSWTFRSDLLIIARTVPAVMFARGVY